MLPPPSHMPSSSHLMGASLALSFRPFLRCKLQLEERNFLFCVLIHSLSSAFNTEITWYYMFSSAKCDSSSVPDHCSLSRRHILITRRKWFDFEQIFLSSRKKKVKHVLYLVLRVTCMKFMGMKLMIPHLVKLEIADLSRTNRFPFSSSWAFL